MEVRFVFSGSKYKE